MAQISFSVPEGRVQILYPDGMCLDELEEAVGIHMSVVRLSRAKRHKPPFTDRIKTTFSKFLGDTQEQE